MLSFRRMKIEDRADMEECLSKRNLRVCESSYATYFLWDDKNKYEICIKDGFLFIRIPDEDGYLYLYPMGEGDLTEAIEELCNYCAEHNENLIMIGMPEEISKEISESFPEQFDFKEDRNSADYLYLAERMISLKGKKLHSKRNFINRFNKEYEGRWSFDSIKAEDLTALFEYEKRWIRANRTSEGDLEAEKCVIKRLLTNMESLKAVGGVLRLDGRIIGFSIGTRLSEDTFDVNIEKADWEIQGSYQVLNNEFAKAFCTDVTYINREDDMGLEGLRKAKLSYDPEMIIDKYRAECKYLSCRIANVGQPCGAKRS